jgi:hypothetical protein
MATLSEHWASFLMSHVGLDDSEARMYGRKIAARTGERFREALGEERLKEIRKEAQEATRRDRGESR